jgi:hypothetical protein
MTQIEMSKERAAIWMACAAMAAEFVGFEEGNRIGIIAWVGSTVAILLGLGSVVLAIQHKSKLGIALGILAALGTIPIIFLSLLVYACAYEHACL